MSISTHPQPAPLAVPFQSHTDPNEGDTMTTDHDRDDVPIFPTYQSAPAAIARGGNRTPWTVVLVVALVALLVAVLFYAKQSRNREDATVTDYTCAMQAKADGAPSWQVVDGRCITY